MNGGDPDAENHEMRSRSRRCPAVCRMTRRGFEPKDSQWFSAQAVDLLRIARRDFQWLLDRGYQAGPALDLVGGHYQLTTRQRTALQRSTAAQSQYRQRESTRLEVLAAKDGALLIDGFNLIITLEVALSGGVLICGGDGVLRDLAGLHGTYRLISQTFQALDLVGRTLGQLAVPEARFFLDAPVSNSGKLKSRILEQAAGWGLPVSVELAANADAVLDKKERIVTSDSVLLDRCASWLNLSAMIVRESIQDAWVVDLAD